MFGFLSETRPPKNVQDQDETETFEKQALIPRRRDRDYIPGIWLAVYSMHITLLLPINSHFTKKMNYISMTDTSHMQ
jgi:hypothetical protein